MFRLVLAVMLNGAPAHDFVDPRPFASLRACNAAMLQLVMSLKPNPGVTWSATCTPQKP